MSAGLSTLLALLCLLQVKHMLADYFLQTPRMLDQRGRYLHLGRLAHVAIHAVGSVLALALVGTPVTVLLGLVLAEVVIHFHIDWCKGRYTLQQQLTPADAAYWWASGIDQALHQFTYIGMVWLWAVAGAAAL